MANATIIITAKNQAKAAFDQVGKQTEKIAQKMMKWDGIFRALLVAGPIAKMGMALFRAGTHTEELGRKAAELREKFKDAAEPLADGLQKALLAAIPIAERLAASLKKVGAEIAYNAAWWGARLSGSKNPAEEARQTLEADARDRANRKMLAEREKYVDYYREREAEAILAGEKEEAEKIKRLEQQYDDYQKAIEEKAKKRIETERAARIDAINEAAKVEEKRIESLSKKRISALEAEAKRQEQLAEKMQAKADRARAIFLGDRSILEEEKQAAKEQKKIEAAVSKARRGIRGSHIRRAVEAYNAQIAADQARAAASKAEEDARKVAEKTAEMTERTALAAEAQVKMLEENLQPREK